jgi:hypothetical protein
MATDDQRDKWLRRAAMSDAQRRKEEKWDTLFATAELVHVLGDYVDSSKETRKKEAHQKQLNLYQKSKEKRAKEGPTPKSKWVSSINRLLRNATAQALRQARQERDKDITAAQQEKKKSEKEKQEREREFVQSQLDSFNASVGKEKPEVAPKIKFDPNKPMIVRPNSP